MKYYSIDEDTVADFALSKSEILLKTKETPSRGLVMKVLEYRYNHSISNLALLERLSDYGRLSSFTTDDWIYILKRSPKAYSIARKNNPAIKDVALSLDIHVALEVATSETLSEDEYMSMMKTAPQIFRLIDKPSDKLQKRFLNAAEGIRWQVEKRRVLSAANDKPGLRQDLKMAMARAGIDPRRIHGADDEVRLAAVKALPQNITYIPDAPHRLRLTALRNSGKAIHLISKPSVPEEAEREQLTAARQSGLAVDLKTASEAVRLAAVRQKGDELYRVPKDERTDEMYLEAAISCGAIIHGFPDALLDRIGDELARAQPKYVALFHKQTEAQQLLAVEARPFEVKRLKNPSPAVVQAALEKQPGIEKYLPKEVLSPSPTMTLV